MLPPRDLNPDLRRIWLRYFLEYRTVSRLPRPLAYKLVGYLGDRDRRRMSQIAQDMGVNLRLVFPDMTDDRIGSYTRAHFRMMAREVLDVFDLPNFSRDSLGKVFLPSGFNEIPQPGTSGPGTIIALGHYGRPIMLPVALGLSGKATGLLTQTIDERNLGLNPIDRMFLQFKMHHAVKLCGGRWIATGDDLRKLYEALDKGENIVILFDLPNAGARETFAAPFLGSMLHPAVGVLRLLRKTGARIVYGVARDKGSAVSVEIRPLPNGDPESTMRAAICELERDVLAEPWQWWQWPYLSTIWKKAG